MTRFLARRLLLAAVTLLVIVTASFFLQRAAPGGPFDEERSVAPEIRERQEKEWNLDRPILVQYGLYIRDMLALDFKRSMKQPEYTVTELIRPRLAVSLSLGFTVLVFGLLVGLPLGVLAALRRRSRWDYLAMAVALLGVSVPNFVIGPILKWLFALKLGWLPESRWVGPSSMVLPTLTLSAIYVATIARLTRSSMLDVLSQDWVRTARARGLSERRIIWGHALKGASVPVVSYLGPAMAGLAVGSVVVERIFNIPGLGTYFVDAAFNRDYTLVMGCVVAYSSILIGMNVIVDMALTLVDPRVKLR